MVAYCETVLLQDLILQAMSQKEVLAEYERKIKTKKEYIKVSKDLKNMGKPTLLGNEIKLTQEEFKDLKQLARNGITMQDENKALKKELNEVKKNFNDHAIAHNKLVAMYNDLQDRFDKLWSDFKLIRDRAQPFFDAVKYAPERVRGFISNILDERRQERQRNKKREKGR